MGTDWVNLRIRIYPTQSLNVRIPVCGQLLFVRYHAKTLPASTSNSARRGELLSIRVTSSGPRWTHGNDIICRSLYIKCNVWMLANDDAQFFTPATAVLSTMTRAGKELVEEYKTGTTF